MSSGNSKYTRVRVRENESGKLTEQLCIRPHAFLFSRALVQEPSQFRGVQHSAHGKSIFTFVKGGRRISDFLQVVL